MTPCICKLNVRRHPVTMASSITRVPNMDCAKHGTAKPAPPKEKK